MKILYNCAFKVISLVVFGYAISLWFLILCRHIKQQHHTPQNKSCFRVPIWFHLFCCFFFLFASSSFFLHLIIRRNGFYLHKYRIDTIFFAFNFCVRMIRNYLYGIFIRSYILLFHSFITFDCGRSPARFVVETNDEEENTPPEYE